MKKIEDQGYSRESFRKNIIYPDFSYSTEYEETTSGTYVTGYYFDGKLERRVCFDMGSFSTNLLAQIRKAGVYLATVKFGKENVKAIVFSYYYEFNQSMQGRIIALDDIDTIKEIINHLREKKQYFYTRIHGYSPCEYLKIKHKEVFNLLNNI